MILGFHRNERVMFYKMPQQMPERESTGANDGCAAIIPRLDRSSSNGYHKPARTKRISKSQLTFISLDRSLSLRVLLHYTRQIITKRKIMLYRAWGRISTRAAKEQRILKLFQFAVSEHFLARCHADIHTLIPAFNCRSAFYSIWDESSII